jgi:hypothetical protein
MSFFKFTLALRVDSARYLMVSLRASDLLPFQPEANKHVPAQWDRRCTQIARSLWLQGAWIPNTPSLRIIMIHSRSLDILKLVRAASLLSLVIACSARGEAVHRCRRNSTVSAKQRLGAFLHVCVAQGLLHVYEPALPRNDRSTENLGLRPVTRAISKSTHYGSLCGARLLRPIGQRRSR